MYPSFYMPHIFFVTFYWRRSSPIWQKKMKFSWNTYRDKLCTACITCVCFFFFFFVIFLKYIIHTLPTRSRKYTTIMANERCVCTKMKFCAAGKSRTRIYSNGWQYEQKQAKGRIKFDGFSRFGWITEAVSKCIFWRLTS